MLTCSNWNGRWQTTHIRQKQLENGEKCDSFTEEEKN